MARILDFADGFESSSEPTSVGLSASTVTNTPSGNLSASNIQDAVNELQGDIDTINGKIGAPSGIASLDGSGKIPTAQLPAIALDTVNVVADIAARDALTVESGDLAKVTDAGGGVTKTYMFDGSGWIELKSDGAVVAHEASASAHPASSITNTPSGNLAASTVQAALNELQSDIDTRATSSALSTHIADTANPHAVTKAQVGLSNVDNTSDATKNAAVAVLTNKDFDGGTASNSNRLTLPKNTKSNLDGLTRKEGTLVYATDQAKAYVDNGTNLIAVGSGSGGTVNFVTNPKAENDTSNAGVYNDGASSRPVDGTGGTATVTLTRNTTNALDTTDFLLTKPASNVQGQGYYWDVTIPRYMRGKVCQITIHYEVASGTYSGGTTVPYTDSDLIAYIYSVTDSKLNEPAPIKLDGGVVGTQYKYTGNFQTSTTDASLRLLLHHATTSTSAFTMKVTTKVSDQVLANGALVSDWTTYTPTITATTTNPTKGSTIVDAARWRRVGDSMEIQYNYRQTSAGSAGSGTYLISIPSGYTIDSNKTFVGTSTNNPVGTFQVGAGTQSGSGVAIAYSSTQIAGAYSNDIQAYNYWSSSLGPFSNANLDFGIHAMVPIAGWGTYQVLSSDSSEGRVVSLRARKNSGSQTSNAAYQDVTSWTEVNKDSFSAFNATTGVYTVQVPGDYFVHGLIGFSANATGIRLVQVIKNSTSEFQGAGVPGSSTTAFVQYGGIVTDCKAGDTIKVQAYQSSGGNLAYAAALDYNTINISRISGNQQVAASESVSFSVTGSTTAASTSQCFIFTSVDHNSQGAYSTTTGKFTCPSPGTYSFTATTFAGTGFSPVLYKNGTAILQGTLASASSVGMVSHNLKLVTNDVVEIRPTGSVTATGATLNAFSGYRTGN